jgi:hypothetical protein
MFQKEILHLTTFAIRINGNGTTPEATTVSQALTLVPKKLGISPQVV